MDVQSDPRLDQLLAHQTWVRGLARRLVLDENDADDLAQDAWVSALQRPPEDRGTPRAWLGRVLRNRTVDRSRTEHNRARRERQSRPRPTAPAPDEVVARAEAHRVLVRTVLGLDEPYRSTVLLRYFDDLTPTDIAARLGVSRDTVKTRLRRALEQLRARLDSGHERGRAEWSAALLPLFDARRHENTAPPTALSGGVLMTTGKKVALIALVAIVALSIWWMADDSVSSRSTARPTTAVAPTEKDAVGSSTPETVPAIAQTPAADPPKPSPVESVPEPDVSQPTVETPKEDEPTAPDVPEPKELTGYVRTADGKPLEDALVYYGNQIDGRGDEPFKPFQARRIQHGVRTAANGHFRLPGKGREVTIWHPEHTSVTLRPDGQPEFRLQPRITFRGLLLDVEGKPRAGVAVTLDRESKATTDAHGRFAIENVEQGLRGLEIGRTYVAVTASAKQKGDVVIEAGIPKLTLTLAELPEDTSLRLMGVLIGKGDGPHSVGIGKGVNRTLEFTNVIPGTYVLLVRPGVVGTVQVDGATATATLGKCTLTVQGPERARFYVLPAGSGTFAELMGGRMGLTMPAEGSFDIEHLAPGRYDVGIDRQGVIGTVEVTEKGATFKM